MADLNLGVSIIMVNYNVAGEVRACLRSIETYAGCIEHEIIVVDNNSPEREIEKLVGEFPGTNFFLLRENLGYSKANNFGVEKAKYDFLLFLNPDTIMIESFLKPMTEYLVNNTNAGACGPMLVYEDLTYQNSWGPKLGIIYECAEAFLFINIYRKLLKYRKRTCYSEGKEFRVNWMSGACLLMRKSVFEVAGCFDEDYFLNYEDIDLGCRLSTEGYENKYFPQYRCVHLDQTSQKRSYEKFTLSRYKSRLIYSAKNYGSFKRILVRFIHILGLLFRLIIVNFAYSDTEKNQRRSGYREALKLYISRRKTMNLTLI